MEVRDTDLVNFTRDLRIRLEESLTEDGACRVVIAARIKTLPVTLRASNHLRRRHPAQMAITRIAWAFANPHDHMTASEVAVHTCQNTGTNGTRLCCRGDHLKKGTREDKEIAEAARRRGFLQR